MTDALYRAWIQKQPSCLTGRYSEWINELGEWRNPACHVRRAGQSGVGYKAEYSCVPLSNEEHAYQHQHGERACLLRFCRDRNLVRLLRESSQATAERIAAEWFDDQVRQYREKWESITGKKIKELVNA